MAGITRALSRPMLTLPAAFPLHAFSLYSNSRMFLGDRLKDMHPNP